MGSSGMSSLLPHPASVHDRDGHLLRDARPKVFSMTCIDARLGPECFTGMTKLGGIPYNAAHTTRIIGNWILMAAKHTETQASSPSETPSNDTDSGDNVDRIRDILFGQQLREFERKFQQIESRLNEDLESLRSELGQQGESLQSYIDSEIGILDSKLKGEADTRQQQLDDLQDELKKTARQIDARLNDLAAQLAEQGREYNQKLLKLQQDISAELKKAGNNLRERLDERYRELSEAKVNRSALAEMLTTLALQLSDEESRD